MHPITRMFWAPVLLYALSAIPAAHESMVAGSGLDNIFHLLGGVAIAYMFYVAVTSYGKQWWGHIPKFAKFIFMISFVIAMGVVWEWYEFLSDFYLGTHNQPSLYDTMKDFFFDTAGGVLAAFIFIFKQKTRS